MQDFLGQAESEELDRSFLRLLRGGTVMGVGGFAKQDFGSFLVASLLWNLRVVVGMYCVPCRED